VNIILFGPPGAGKGTQGDFLAKNFNLIKISTGDLLRREIKKKSSLGNEIKSTIDKGMFVSDKVVNDLINDVVLEKKNFNKMIFDGYPRNIFQAEFLDSMIKKNNQNISCVLNINVDQDVIIKRILGRQICSNCGNIFNKFYNPANSEKHRCDIKYLKTRSDDTEDTIKKRYKTYEKITFPIIKYYQDQNLLFNVNGMAKITEINKEISGFIKRL
tara:strand:- start:2441 stop:3085 length:645 start_codon:yes stop_codon:yes gene_type:complete